MLNMAPKKAHSMSQKARSEERKRGREAGKVWGETFTTLPEGENKVMQMINVILGNEREAFWAGVGIPIPSEEFSSAFVRSAQTAIKKKLEGMAPPLG